VEGIAEVSVELTFDPPYSQDMMSEVAKLELGFM
jgi:metal-sulfur cluster biosynthetic enzyme